LSTPTLLIPEGTLENEAKFNSETHQYEQSILIHDNDEKGTFSAQLIKATNLAGLVSNAFKNESRYVIGGFVKRTLQFQAFSNETALGTSIVNTPKLSVTDKDEILMSYVANIENNRLSYSITNPPNQVNPKGNILHWNDEQAVNNNSTGLATISIEELP
jgi:translation initiation factor 6 (eIF-6)